MLFSFTTTPVTFTSQYINQDKQRSWCWAEASFLFTKNSAESFYSYVTGNITTKTGNKDTTYNNLLGGLSHQQD